MRRGRRREIARAKPAPSILLVEDRSDQREMYASFLASKGFTVRTAPDGLTAIRIARSALPDIIVMDLSLPHVDGWEITRRLTKDPQTRHIPIIACSAHVLGGAVERALVAGCVAYLCKPCLPEELLNEIRRFLPRAA